jgi:hypothetical protein
MTVSSHSAPVSGPNRVIVRRGMRSVGAAMELFETGYSVRATKWLEALSTTARRTCPSTQRRYCHELIFQIHSEVVQNVAGS